MVSSFPMAIDARFLAAAGGDVMLLARAIRHIRDHRVFPLPLTEKDIQAAVRTIREAAAA